jgi:two-component system response regulator YesN
MIHTLIIVDDEIEIRNGLMGYSWERLGFQALASFDDGKDALSFVQERPVDVVLCDIRMPVMDGLSFAKEVQEKTIPTKIVFLTGFKDMDLIRSAIRYGCKDYLLKPTNFVELDETFTRIGEELDKEWGNHLEFHGTSSNVQLVNASLKFIETHIETSCLTVVSDFLHISPSYLSKLFKETTGKMFSEYCINVKMKKAKELLIDPRIPIQEVSHRVGYSNTTNFGRAFKAEFGISPSDFRNKK